MRGADKCSCDFLYFAPQKSGSNPKKRPQIIMKFSVCIKQVPDVTAPIQIKDGQLIMEAERMVLDAYSASAVEESLVITETHGGSVDVISIGPDKAKETIRKALAMGAESASHIVAETEGFDSHSYARILAAYFVKHPCDVIALGKQAQDSDSGLTGSMLAAQLDLPYATNAVGLEMDTERKVLKVTRQGDGGQEIIELPTPCIVTCSNDMNDPRIPSLKGIMKSKKKPILSVSLDELGLSEADVAPGTTVVRYEEIPSREPGKKFEGEASELAQNVTKLLEEEAGVL